jgi:formylglycine-generating enzyme required for sulfatase activity
MAPESPGNLVILELLVQDGKLVGEVERATPPQDEASTKGAWLELRWYEQPATFSPVGGGVAFIRLPPGYVLEPKSAVDPDSFSSYGSNFRWNDTAHGEGLVFILILPTGYTLSNPHPIPREVKAFNDHVAVLWTPDGKYGAQVTIRWNIEAAQETLELEVARLKELISGGTVEINVGAHVDSSPATQQLVLLIHGIRTHAVWQNRVQRIIGDNKQTIVVPIRYGYFDAFQFWCPVFTRAKVIKKVLKRYDDSLQRYASPQVSIIAHSFGTYAISKIIEQNARIRLNRLLLCGSIVPEDFDWALYDKRVNEIVNDIGTRDIWPVLAKATTWGYGASGTFGFGNPFVHDRFHDYYHSDFFNSKFVHRYWAPFIKNGNIVVSEWDEDHPEPPWRISMLSKLPLRWVILLVLIAIVSAAILVTLRIAINFPRADGTGSTPSSHPTQISSTVTTPINNTPIPGTTGEVASAIATSTTPTNEWVPISGGLVFSGEEQDTISESVDPFEIQISEVTNQAYFACFQSKRCGVPTSNWYMSSNGMTYTAELAHYPVYAVTWNDANAYCQFIDARLPTEAEWIRAARGGSKQLYPWDGAFNSDYANVFETQIGEAVHVTSQYFEKGRSGSGLFHLAGNVREWVVDTTADTSTSSDTFDQHTAKGGSFQDRAENATIWSRFTDNELPYVGIRCARNRLP